MSSENIIYWIIWQYILLVFFSENARMYLSWVCRNFLSLSLFLSVCLSVCLSLSLSLSLSFSLSFCLSIYIYIYICVCVWMYRIEKKRTSENFIHWIIWKRFLNKISNTNYITQIWNKTPPTDIECNKAVSSFSLHCTTHMAGWRSNNRKA